MTRTMAQIELGDRVVIGYDYIERQDLFGTVIGGMDHGCRIIIAPDDPEAELRLANPVTFVPTGKADEWILR